MNDTKRPEPFAPSNAQLGELRKMVEEEAYDRGRHDGILELRNRLRDLKAISESGLLVAGEMLKIARARVPGQGKGGEKGEG